MTPHNCSAKAGGKENTRKGKDGSAGGQLERCYFRDLGT